MSTVEVEAAQIAQSWERRLLVAVAIVAAPLLFCLYFLPAFTPDELWFLRDAAKIGREHVSLWNQAPHLGYGAIFWTSFSWIVGIAGEGKAAIEVFRLFSFLLVSSIPALIWNSRSPNRIPALVFWIAMPMTWWIGKIASPEIPAYVLCAWAFLLVRKRPWLAWAVFGLALGFKLTALPVGIVLLVLSLRCRAWFAPIAAAPAFLLANPILLHNPAAFRHELLGASSPITISLNTAIRVLASTHWEWDGVPSGGLFAHGVAFPAAICLVLLCARMRSWLTVGMLLMWAGAIVLSFRERFLLWYLFPVMALTPFFLLQMARSRLLLAAVAFQFVVGAPLIVKQYRNKIANYEELRSDRSKDSIDRVLRAWNPDTVTNNFTTGRFVVDTFSNPARYLDENPSQYVLLDGLVLWMSPDNRRVAIIVGDRLASLSPIYDVRHRVEMPAWCGDYRLAASAQVPAASMYLLVRLAHLSH